MPSLYRFMDESVQKIAGEALGLDDISIGIVAFLIGLFLTFFGRRFLKTLIAVMCCLFGLVFGWLVIPSMIQPFFMFQTETMYIVQIVCSIVGAALLGWIGHMFWKIAVLASGALAGFFAGSWIFTLFDTITLESYISRKWTLIGLAAAGALISLAFEDYIVICTSILIGAFTMMYGLDKFLQLGFSAHIQHIFDYRTLALDRLNTGSWCLIGTGGLLAIIGFATQCHQYKKKH